MLVNNTGIFCIGTGVGCLSFYKHFNPSVKMLAFLTQIVYADTFCNIFAGGGLVVVVPYFSVTFNSVDYAFARSS